MSAATAISTRSSSGRGKDVRDWSDLVVQALPLYIQEKLHPKVLIDDLLKVSKAREKQDEHETPDLFADFQRPAERRRQDRVLSTRRQLVEPNDPRR